MKSESILLHYSRDIALGKNNNVININKIPDFEAIFDEFKSLIG